MQIKYVLAAAMLFCGTVAAAAHDYQLGSLQIVQPWVRATPKGASVGAGYLKITNKGTTPDRLVAGSSPVAAKVEIHEMTMRGGIMRMRPLAHGLEIKPGKTVELKPGSFHIMLMGLKQQLKKGDTVKATLQFETAGKIEVEFPVTGIGGPPRMDPGMKMH
jgi:periplasmic copper chaperone A